MARVHPHHLFTRLHRHKFWGDYTVPLALSGAFIILVVAAAGIRAYQQNALSRLLAQVATVGQNYASLLSDDKTSPVVRNNSNNLNKPSGGSTQGGSFSVSPGGAGTQSGNGSSGGSGTSGQTQPFAASISSFVQGSTTLECSSQQPNKAKCSKRYAFNVVVSTLHGPGTVRYGWRSNWQAANFDGSYIASSGTAQKALTTSLLIPCLSPGSYNLQFVITAPVQVQSSIITFTHSCAGI